MNSFPCSKPTRTLICNMTIRYYMKGTDVTFIVCIHKMLNLFSCLYILKWNFPVKYYCNITLSIAVLCFELSTLKSYIDMHTSWYTYFSFTIFFLSGHYCSFNKGLVSIWYTPWSSWAISGLIVDCDLFKPYLFYSLFPVPSGN